MPNTGSFCLACFVGIWYEARLEKSVVVFHCFDGRSVLRAVAQDADWNLHLVYTIRFTHNRHEL